VLVLVGSSNAVNLTDGLDGLAIGCTVLAAASMEPSHTSPGTGKWRPTFRCFECPRGGNRIVCAALCGSCLGFLWFNAHPADIFMGHRSLALGGILGLVALLVKQELLLVVVGACSWRSRFVLLQIVSFKLTGRRIFPIAPLHHTLEFYGWTENKIVVRFWIVSAVLAIFTLSALRMR